MYDGGGEDGSSEDIKVLELPFGEALAMIEHGEIQDAKTIMLLYHARVAGLFDQATAAPVRYP